MCGSRQAPSTTGTARPLLLACQSTPAPPAKRKDERYHSLWKEEGFYKCKIQIESSLGHWSEY